MRSSTRYTLASALLTMASLTQPVCGHSWVESLSVIAPNGTFTGDPGYARGNGTSLPPFLTLQHCNANTPPVLRTSPGFGDPTMVNLIPPNGRPNQLLPTDMMCKSTQQNMVQTDGSPRLKAPAGSFVALRYQENGHVTLPENQPGKPPNRGTVYVYGTTQPKPDDTLLSIHKVWNSDGSGGDKRGVLLASQSFDDSQCYQVNGGKISTTRQADFKHAANQLMGANLWCQNDVKLPSDAPSGKPYTLYWVWDWPTAPGGDPGLPKGKEEIYTTCIDIDVTAAHEQKSVAKFVDGQPLDNAGIKSYLNGAGAGPTAAVSASTQSTNPVATSLPPSVASSQPVQGSGAPSPNAASDSGLSMSVTSSGSPAAAFQASSTAAAVSEIGDGQPQAPVPATSQAPPASSQAPAPAVSSQPIAPALNGVTTVYVTKTVTAPTETSSVAVSGSSVAPLVHAPSPTTAYTNLGSAKFRFI